MSEVVPRALSAEEAAALNQTVVVPAVDAAGLWLGNVDPATPGITRVPRGPREDLPGTRWDFELQAWVRDLPINELLAKANTDIDAAAGAARLRYITEVPGQQGTYIDKAAEAQAFKDAGYTGTVPPLVQAEVDSYAAAGTSITAQQAADSILQISDYWRATVNPGIECARLSGKRQAEVAAQLPDETLARQQIEQAREAALQALAAI